MQWGPRASRTEIVSRQTISAARTRGRLPSSTETASTQAISAARCRLLLSVALALAPAAYAQWTVTNLAPAGATRSVANATSGGQQVGFAIVDGVGGVVPRAGLWSGTAGSWVDLHPAGGHRLPTLPVAVSSVRPGRLHNHAHKFVGELIDTAVTVQPRSHRGFHIPADGLAVHHPKPVDGPIALTRQPQP